METLIVQTLCRSVYHMVSVPEVPKQIWSILEWYPAPTDGMETSEEDHRLGRQLRHCGRIYLLPDVTGLRLLRLVFLQRRLVM